MKTESLIFKYNTVAAEIAKADSKAQILIGVELFIVGYVLGNYAESYRTHFTDLVFVIFLMTACSSLYFLYLVIKPRLTEANRGSLIYFRDITLGSSEDEGKTLKQIRDETDAEFINDIAFQIIALAKVANGKYTSLSNAQKTIVASLVSGLILAITKIWCA